MSRRRLSTVGLLQLFSLIHQTSSQTTLLYIDLTIPSDSELFTPQVLELVLLWGKLELKIINKECLQLSVKDLLPFMKDTSVIRRTKKRMLNNNFETKRNQFFIERLKKRTKWVVTCLQAMNNQNLKKAKSAHLYF